MCATAGVSRGLSLPGSCARGASHHLAVLRPRVCRCYKYLDKCKHQIVPHEVKEELHNVDTQALFHCNCTRRVCVQEEKAVLFPPLQGTLCSLGSDEVGPSRLPTLASSC